MSVISETYFPPEGTTSTYSWDFTGFPEISTMNSKFNDTNTSEDTINTINPTKAEFTVTYVSYGEFLIEEIDGVMENATGSQEYYITFLVNKTTREYVNSEGETTCMGGVNGYIDPFIVEIGSQVEIGGTLLTVTTKENVSIAGQDRGSWKLEYISEWGNQTFHYDIETGILLKARLETTEVSIGSGAEIGERKEDKISHTQKLTSTNAFDIPKTTLASPFGALMFCLTSIGCITIIQRRKNR
ncbi:MAG: hypothetical protein KAT16_01300 [Candidatus Heimdallarchaeota archaeon]|nr:hypothetical protein [Candidatus Heimdallarchaeota archaeon]